MKNALNLERNYRLRMRVVSCHLDQYYKIQQTRVRPPPTSFIDRAMELDSTVGENHKEFLSKTQSEDVHFPITQPAEEDSCGAKFKKFCDESSFSAVAYGFRNKPCFLRILWAGVVVLLIAGFCAVTLQGIILLAKEPTATSIKLTREESVDFPAVTICNLNIINDTSLLVLNTPGYDVSSKLNELFIAARSTPPNEQGCKDIAREAVQNIDPAYNVNFGGLTTFARFYPKNLILSCSYIGEDCINSFTPVNTVEGVCFTFNGPDTEARRKANATGVRQGLRLQLSGNTQIISQSLEGDIGYKVVIHNQNEPPRPESDGIAVALRSATYIAMKTVRSVDNTQYYSGRQCKDPIAYSNGKVSLGKYPAYSPDLCLYDCFYTTIADQCGCVERDLYTPVSSPYTEMKNCSLADLCCEIIQFDSFSKVCKCLPKCDTIDRTLTISSSTMDDPDIVAVNIYYETLVVEERETLDSYTPWSLISDIGGNTALFLGFNLLTLAELFMFVAGALAACCSRNQRAKAEFQRHRIN